MNINKKQLISFISERTGMDRSEADDQLKKLIEHIQQVGEDQNKFHIEGFGTFTTVQDRLDFEPADVFETEINNRYAGMKPIELIGAYKEPQTGEIPALEEEEAEKEASHIDAEEDKKDEMAARSEAQTRKDDEAEPPEVMPEKEEEPTENIVDQEPTETVTDKEEVTASESAAEQSQKTHKPSGKPSKDPIGRVMLIILIVLILAAAGWFAYDFGLFSEKQGSEQLPAQENPTQQQPEDAGAAETVDPTADPAAPVDNEGSPSGNETQRSIPAGNENGGASVDNKPYGLYGEPNTDLAGGYYTIVIHSLRTRELAEELAQKVDGPSFRINIKQVTIDGTTYFRVSIGQFKTNAAARDAISKLPEPLKSNNFITYSR